MNDRADGLVGTPLTLGQVTFDLVGLEFEHGQDLQGLLERCNDYSQVSFGIDTAPADAQSQYLSGLELVGADQKRLVGAYRALELVAAIDQLFGYPDASSVSIGLMVVDPRFRSVGLGSRLLTAIEAEARYLGHGNVYVYCHVANNIRASPFWKRHGYQPIRREMIRIVPTIERERIVLTREL